MVQYCQCFPIFEILHTSKMSKNFGKLKKVSLATFSMSNKQELLPSDTVKEQIFLHKNHLKIKDTFLNQVSLALRKINTLPIFIVLIF